MVGTVSNAHSIAGSLCAVLVLSSAAIAAGKTTVIIDNPAYTQAQRQVEVEPGRRLNLYCTGKGSPTVVFDAGLGDASDAWALVQPVIAAHTQACSYDQAGMGFSDPGNRAGTSANIVDDLHRLLVAASIKPPYILVGHSYGGMNVRLFADTYPAEVVGMVLVDSSSEDWNENIWRLDPKQQTFEQFHAEHESGWQAQRECVTAASTGFVEGTDLYKRCVGEPDPLESKEINDAYMKAYRSPGHQQAVLTELESVHDASADQLHAAWRWFGAMPLIVLIVSPGTTPSANETQSHRDAANRIHTFLADRMAALSTRGPLRMVPNAKHEIQLTEPDAVNSAILEVLEEATPRK
jgi:pimeloyl-ACP methyl ester carboxylesterase